MKKSREYSKEDIAKWADSLAYELVSAKIHMLHADAIRELVPKYRFRIQKFADIWGYTYWAHVDATIMHLCRVYDRTSLNLHRLLLAMREHEDWINKSAAREEVRRHPILSDAADKIRDIDTNQLASDARDVSQANDRVSVLQKWRDRRFFHKTSDDVWNFERFTRRHPLRNSDISWLIQNGLKILNRYTYQTVGKASYVRGDLTQEYRKVFEIILRAQKGVRGPAASAQAGRGSVIKLQDSVG